MMIIDGSLGEGGGQVLRTSLALSLVTGKPFRIDNIRAGRKSPGLLRQHLTAVGAAAQVGEASVDGAAMGSTSMTFIPRALRAGDYAFSIGTAGSTTLVLQTILLPLAVAGAPSTVVIDGGTHNPAAPPFDFLDQAFLPLLRRMGVDVNVELVRPGFFPAGGGQIRATITPVGKLGRLDLVSRGPLVRGCVRAVVANLSYSIATREVRAAAAVLGWGDDVLQAHTLRGSIGPGNSVSIIVESEQVTDVFTGFGARGVRAEVVAENAAAEAKRYLDSNAAVGQHLADQLLLPMALGDGGSFTTLPLTGHTTTNASIIQKFLDVKIAFEAGEVTTVRVGA